MSDPNKPDLDVPPANKPMSVQLARALAEAADGFAGFETPVYLVVPYEPIQDMGKGGFHVSGPYKSWERVPHSLQRSVRKGDCGFFGPFDSGKDPRPSGSRVTAMDLQLKDTSRKLHLVAKNVDALFFSARAVEKFALPYYERIFGPEFAERVRDGFTQSNVQVMAHYPWTEYSDGGKLAQAPVFLRYDTEGAVWVSMDGVAIPPFAADDAPGE